MLIKSARTLGSQSLITGSALAIMLTSSAELASAQSTSPRTRSSFNEGWRFLKEKPQEAKVEFTVEKWRYKMGKDQVGLAEDTAAAGWKDYTIGEDIFSKKPGFAWFRTTIVTDKPLPGRTALNFASVDDNATVYLNGQQVATHTGWNASFEVNVGSAWKANGPNELAILVENVGGGGGVSAVTLRKSSEVAAEPDFNDASWRTLNLPHDWGVEGPFDIALPGETGKLPWDGTGWYRKKFNVPATDQGRRIVLEIDGAMSYSTVWINGKEVGGRPYGYSSYQLDLTPFVKFGGDNVVSIRLNNLPNSSRWYPGGGIYRNVWLTKTGPVHVGQWGTFVTTEVKDGNAKVSIATTLRNDSSKAENVRLVSTIIGDKGQTIATGESAVTIDANGENTAKATLDVKNPRLWSTKDPFRYTLVSQIMRGTTVLDRYETPFGIRTIEWNADKGFLLNGTVVKLNGVCQHHDLGALGAAINTRALERQIEILHEMGVNAIRTSHNPPAPEFLELCDRKGILVIDEFSDTWTYPKKPNGYAVLFKKWADTDLRGLIRRDRNHPSVIAWSTGNEIGEQYGGHEVSAYLTGIVHEEDRSRPVTAGLDQIPSGYNGFQKTMDVFGYNYKPFEYAKLHAAEPKLPLYGSETASCISSRGEYFFPVSNNQGEGKSNFQMSSYDLYAPGWASWPDMEFMHQDKNPYVAGEFVWTGFDYLGEPTPYNSDMTVLTNFHTPEAKAKAEEELKALGKIRVPSRSSYFGIVDLAGFKKDRFYLYQARWRPDLPMAHILPHWNWPDRVGQVTPVHVYTSGDEAELFLNGKSLGRKKKGQYEYRIRWNEVVYEPGELKVVAYKNGQKWAEETVRTTGAATKLAATPDRAEIRANGQDLSFVTVAIQDANGVMVPRTKNPLTFEVSGPGEIIATDNGDATDLTAFPSLQRKAFNGLALAIVRAKAPGKITVKVTAEGLTTGTSTITATK